MFKCEKCGRDTYRTNRKKVKKPILCGLCKPKLFSDYTMKRMLKNLGFGGKEWKK